MSRTLYYTSEFARKASVSVRTLRYYDKMGLLSPAQYTESGHRLYSETDFLRLQQILSLKFLGFSLQEIQQCIEIGPTSLQESLALQKAMMREKRARLDVVIQAIIETEALLQANTQNWEAIIHVIQVTQMAQTNDWQRKYFTLEQMQQMEDLSKRHYTEEQHQQLAERGKHWTEADQQVVTQQWNALFAELKRLTAEGQDPASPDAQTLVRQWRSLVHQFTQGDVGIETSLRDLTSEVAKTPENKRPYAFPVTQEEGEFLQKAMAVQQ